MNLKSTNNPEINKYELEVEVTPEEFNDAVNAVYKRESKKMNVPGFRKGHAPRAFIEKYYGEEVFYEAAIDHLYRPLVMDAIEKSGLNVISVGDFKIDEIGKDKGILCKLTVITKPEANIQGYKGIEVKKQPVTVTAEDVDREIDRVRERNSRMVTVEDRAAENGDVAEIDFDGYEVLRDGRPTRLTPKEFEIVALLAASAGKVFTREEILEHIWGEHEGMDLRSVTVFVRKIREKIEPVPSDPRYLLTVWRVGYKFASN